MNVIIDYVKITDHWLILFINAIIVNVDIILITKAGTCELEGEWGYYRLMF